MRVGDPVEDLCRVCKDVRGHHVLVVDEEGCVARVMCDTCRSQHNFRAGWGGRSPGREAPPVVSESERSVIPMGVEGGGTEPADLEMLLRRIIREECGITPVAPAARWRGGTLILRSAKEGLQDKVIPIEAFFHKIVMLRNRLRVLEQQINGMAIPEDEKIRLQGYLTGCYGTLTTFNILFAEEEDRFVGASGKEPPG